MVGNNHRFFLSISLNRIHGRAVHRVAPRWIAAVGPVDRPVREVEFEVDGFGQAVIEEFNVSTDLGSLALGNLEIGAKDASLAGVVRTFLSPIKLAGFDVERDSYAPFLNVPP